MSPSLDVPGETAIVRTLVKAGIPEVGKSAVLISALTVLGPSAASRRYRYREPYPHLPDVDAIAIPYGPACSWVALVVRPKKGPAVELRGRFCLADAKRMIWTLRGQLRYFVAR